jgi:hypothetical protein
MSRYHRIIILGVMLALGTPAVADGQSVRAGLHGGLALSTLANLEQAIDFGGPVDVKTRRGFAVGGFLHVRLTDRVAVQPDVLFATGGATPTDGVNQLRIELAYLDCAFLARLMPLRDRPLYVLAGPSVNVNVRAKAIDIVPVEAVIDLADTVKTSEFALVVGAGFELGRSVIEGRYLHGVTDITRGPGFHAPVRNRSVLILVGVRFP